MAEGLLRHALAWRGHEVAVTSAGFLAGGGPATDHAVEVMARRGIDISGHTSTEVTPERLDEVDLVVAMARQHVREAAVAAPACFPHTFTLKQLVRLARAAGPRGPQQSLRAWATELGASRRPQDLLGESEDDDVVDPVGLALRVYKRRAREIEELVDELVPLAWP